MGTGCCEQVVLSKAGRTVKRSVKTRPIIRYRRATISASNRQIATTATCVLPLMHVDLFRSPRTVLTLIKTICNPAELMLFVFDSVHVSLHDDQEQ